MFITTVNYDIKLCYCYKTVNTQIIEFTELEYVATLSRI